MKKRRIRAKFCCPSQKARLDGSLRLLNPIFLPASGVARMTELQP